MLFGVHLSTLDPKDREQLERSLHETFESHKGWGLVDQGGAPAIVFVDPGTTAWDKWTAEAAQHGLPLCVPVVATANGERFRSQGVGFDFERVSEPSVTALGALFDKVQELHGSLGAVFRRPCPWAVSVETNHAKGITTHPLAMATNQVVDAVLKAVDGSEPMVIELDGVAPLYVFPKSKVCVPGITPGSEAAPFEDWLKSMSRATNSPRMGEVSDEVQRSFRTGWTVGREIGLGDLVWSACMYGSDALLPGIDEHAKFWLSQRPAITKMAAGAPEREILTTLFLKRPWTIQELTDTCSLPTTVLYGFLNAAQRDGILHQQSPSELATPDPQSTAVKNNFSFRSVRSRVRENVR